MAFLGMRGTGDWATNQRPENWRESILFLYPNGSATLTAILSMLPSEGVNDWKFHWWDKGLPSQGGTVSSIYTEVTLTTEYTSGAAANDTVYAKCAAAVAQQFREGHEVKLGKADDYRYDTVGICTGRSINGASSYVAVKLAQAPPNATSQDLDEVDRIDIIGSAHAQGATMPDAIGYDPTEYDNYAQISRTSLSITETARLTRLRTGDAYKEMKREALELHSIEREKSYIWGVKYSGTGSNGKPLTMTDGIKTAIIDNASDNVDQYDINTDYSGLTWLQGGEDWLDEQLEQIFRYGSAEKLALCGSVALRGINRLAKSSGQIQLTPKTASYGLKVVEWVTPTGTLYLKTHPLFSYNATTRNNMLIVEPKFLKERILRDTIFKKSEDTTSTANNSKDSTDEEFLTEAGLEYHHPSSMGYLAGFNSDNSV